MATTALVKRSSGDLTYEKFTLTPTDIVFPAKWTWKEWAECGQALEKANAATYWWIGGWAYTAAQQWKKDNPEKADRLRGGKNAKPGVPKEFWIEKVTDSGVALGWKTVKRYAELYARVRVENRFSTLTVNHHQAVQKFWETPDVQQRWLERAVEEGWSPTELRRAIAAKDREEMALVLKGKFQVFYADPPWSYSNIGFDASPATEHYPTMPVEDICAMPVEKYAADDAVLFLWATNPLLPDCLEVVDAWGFEYKTNFVWVKDVSMHLGFYNYGQHELLLVATRGSMLPKEKSMVQSVLSYPRAEHSAKPPEVYDVIGQMYPRLRCVELFARGEERKGWTFWGNEVMRGSDV